jgi:carboxyl-terminal processing protease
MRDFFRNSVLRITILLAGAIFTSFAVIKFVFDRNEVIFSLLVDSLKQLHYSPETLDDKFSAKVFDQYLNTDFNKKFLLKEDIDFLTKYKYEIDDQIASQRQDFFKAAKEIVMKRISEKEHWSAEILSKPLDYKKDEEYEFDPKKIEFAVSNDALKDEWRRMLKYQVLFRLDDLLTRQEEAVAKNDTSVKVRSLDSLEADARRKTMKSQEDAFRRIRKLTDKDRFSEYANAIATAYDPHTQYFAPKDKKRFDMGMSGQFEGIGARLMQKDGILKVSEVIVGSPSYKQGDLKQGDEILKVAQGAAEPVDITHMDIDEAIELIKGPKGTEVRLTVRKTDNSVKVIPIVRDVVELEETFAKSAILENKNKIGYIYLPTFYTDFTRKGARHSSQDMRKEIEKLKKQGITGLIIDLRDNGGGSLQEVVDMAGLFFEKGPVVQVKGKNNSPVSVLEDRNPEVNWDGPLAILINHNSASASEILAAAIQDYKRGVIVGTSSFGKGTVQSFVDLDQLLIKQFDTIKPIGSVKITQQKFYRINGGATQLKGVTPDVKLPDPYSLIEFGEKQYDHPMPWDEIVKASYTEFRTINYPKVIANSQKRIKNNSAFALLEKQAQEVKAKKDDTRYNLNLDKFRAEQKQLREQNKKYEDLKREIKGFTASQLEEDRMRLAASDTSRIGREKRWVNNLSKDVYIHEATNVINDLK